MSKLTDKFGDTTEFVAIKDDVSLCYKVGDRLTLEYDDNTNHPYFTQPVTNQTVCAYIFNIKRYIADPAENSTRQQKYDAFEWLRGESISDEEHSEHAAVLMYELRNLDK